MPSQKAKPESAPKATVAKKTAKKTVAAAPVKPAKKAVVAAKPAKPVKSVAAAKSAKPAAPAAKPAKAVAAKPVAPPAKPAKAVAAKPVAPPAKPAKAVAAKPAKPAAAKPAKPTKPAVKAAPAPEPTPAKATKPPKAAPTPEPAPVRVVAKPAPEPAPAKKPKSESKYTVGDKVVHPQHGAATIAKRLKQEFGGEKRDYYVLDIATEQLTVMVPVDKIDEVIRPIISKTEARKVLAVLKDEPQEAGANWSRWYKVLNEKMTSGDIFQVAEVVRDLNFAQQTKGISPALKRMLSKARLTLTSELSFSLEIDDEESVRRLEKALPKFEAVES
jgi:CarD family transcriptional regulator